MSGQDSNDTENYTEAVGGRLTPQTKRQFDRYAEVNELGNSQAVRRLIRAGLQAEQQPTPVERLASPRLAVGGLSVFLFGGVMIALAGLGAWGLQAFVTLAGGGMFVSFVGVLLVLVALLANVALARPLRALLPGFVGDNA